MSFPLVRLGLGPVFSSTQSKSSAFRFFREQLHLLILLVLLICNQLLRIKELRTISEPKTQAEI